MDRPPQDDSGTWLTRLFYSDKLPMMLQAEAAECGLACLAMVAAAYGQRHTLSDLRRRFSASLKGTTLKSVMDMADGLGMVGRPLRLEVDELVSLKPPCVLHWNLAHYVVLKKAWNGPGGVWAIIHDPARGVRKVAPAEIGRSFTGVALELTPTPAFTKKKQVERVRLTDMWSTLKGLKGPVIQLFLLALVVQVIGVFSPMLNQLIIDDAISKGDMDLLTTIGMGMVILLLIQTGIGLLQGFVGMYLGTQLSFQMQGNLLRHALRLPVAWFEKRHIGDIMSRFGSLGPVQGFLTSVPVGATLNVIMLVVGGTMAVLYSPLLFGCVIASMIIPVIVQAVTFPWVRRKTDEGISLGAVASTTFMETLRGARTFKLFGKERERVSQWQNDTAASVNNSVTMQRVGLWGGAGLGIVTGLQGVAVWWLGAKQVIDGTMSLGMLMAFQSYAGQFSGALSGLIGLYFQWKTLELHLERLADVVHEDPEVGVDEPIQEGRLFEGHIGADKLSFRYATHEPLVFKDASFSIDPGQFVAIIGPSGGGKTTLMKVLLGLLDPTEGEVKVEGVGLKNFGVRTFRHRIGAVLQDDRLLAGTIADNVSFFDADLDMAKVEECLAKACVLDDILKMPMGTMTLVGDLGSTLSGGQQQRVLLARALYREPTILFLDEGTANLDPETEARVSETLRGLSCTRIFVAHREAAIAGADRTLLVAGGTVTELTEQAQVAAE
ncbi:peptidase domain-containing ABC transporter [Aquidulcibacter sp.]|uniref:peptidase domain-containing ABC transporter n=1 Tax=Aquidulcibacter sp. TaxID=2052990 RepID=UPI0037841233